VSGCGRAGSEAICRGQRSPCPHAGARSASTHDAKRPVLKGTTNACCGRVPVGSGGRVSRGWGAPSRRLAVAGLRFHFHARGLCSGDVCVSGGLIREVRFYYDNNTLRSFLSSLRIKRLEACRTTLIRSPCINCASTIGLPLSFSRESSYPCVRTKLCVACDHPYTRLDPLCFSLTWSLHSRDAGRRHTLS